MYSKALVLAIIFTALFEINTDTKLSFYYTPKRPFKEDCSDYHRNCCRIQNMIESLLSDYEDNRESEEIKRLAKRVPTTDCELIYKKNKYNDWSVYCKYHGSHNINPFKQTLEEIKNTKEEYVLPSDKAMNEINNYLLKERLLYYGRYCKFPILYLIFLFWYLITGKKTRNG